jgi:hypothetical protein
MATRTLAPRTTRKADRERAEAAGYAAINLSVSRREAMNAAKRLDTLGETEALRQVQTAITALDDAKTAAGL